MSSKALKELIKTKDENDDEMGMKRREIIVTALYHQIKSPKITEVDTRRLSHKSTSNQVVAVARYVRQTRGVVSSVNYVRSFQELQFNCIHLFLCIQIFIRNEHNIFSPDHGVFKDISFCNLFCVDPIEVLGRDYLALDDGFECDIAIRHSAIEMLDMNKIFEYIYLV